MKLIHQSFHFLKLPFWTMIWLLVFPGQAKSQTASVVYVWEFTTRNGERNDLTMSLTEEFEEALTQSECCNILQRRYYSRLFDQKENERAISNLGAVPKTAKDGLKSLEANTVVFGEVYDDTNSGQVRISVSFESFEGKILKKASSYLPKFAIADPSKREEAVDKLMTELNFSVGKTNPAVSSLPKKEKMEEKILGTWIFETQYTHLLYPNGLRKPTVASYKYAVRFTLEENDLSGESLWLETQYDNCGAKDTKISGKIIENKVDLIFEFIGNCCKGTKSQVMGEFVSDNKLTGKIIPFGPPTGDCANGWATFSAVKEK